MSTFGSSHLHLHVQVRKALATWRVSNTSLLELELLAPDELPQMASGGTHPNPNPNPN